MNKKKSPDRSKPGPEKRSGKELFVKGFMSSLVCLWMFVLGLLVGRGTAPVRFDIERLQDELSKLKAATIEERVQRYQVAFQELDKEKDLGFHEALKDEETELPSAALSSTAPSSGSSTKGTADSSDRAPAKTEPLVSKKTKDSEFRKQVTTETPGTWAIQVAATQDEDHGNQLVERLEKMRFPAYIVKATIPGKGTWYRIRIGGYTSRKEAEADKAELEKERFSPMIVSP